MEALPEWFNEKFRKTNMMFRPAGCEVYEYVSDEEAIPTATFIMGMAKKITVTLWWAGSETR